MTTFTSTNGNNNFNGNSSSDKVIFAGSAAGYRVELVNGFVQVVDIDSSNGDSGTDILTGIETLAFAGRTYTLAGELGLSGTGETRINSYTASAQFYPAVTGLVDGGYVVTWSSGGQDGSNLGTYAQRYDANGLAIGSETQVNTYTLSAQYNSAITALADGGHVITWSSYGPVGSYYGIYAQRYDAAGNKAGTETLVSTHADTDKLEADTAGLADGGYVITWLSLDQDGDSYGIHAQRYDADGLAVGGETKVNTYPTSAYTLPAVTGLADGGYVITWDSWGQDGAGSGIYAQRYDADGNEIGVETLINTYIASDQIEPDITALTDGGYVITWNSSGQDGLYLGTYAQRYDADGLAVGDETHVNTWIWSDQLFTATAALADGGYVITWGSWDQDGSGWGIYAQRYAADGSAAGGVTRINTYTGDSQERPDIAALADGGYVITWMSQGQDGDDAGIYAQRFDAEGNAVVGSLKITGTAGADLLNGGEGAQTLIGLAGNDTLNGGNGSDTLNGGTGNDVFMLSNADTIVEASGGGTDTVQASFTYTLGKQLENLSLTGTSAVNGTGNALANRITGNSANNTLNGLDGNDTLDGGDGNDRTLGGNGNDILNGGLGNDTLTGGAGNDRFVFSTTRGATNIDSITDFNAVADTIALDNDIFTGLVAGALNTKFFWAGAAAHDANDRVIYNASTGALFYDTNGNAAGGEMQIATLAPHTALTAADFLVIE